MAGVAGAFVVLIARILVFATIAPSLPAVRARFHASYFQAGLGMSMAFAGSMLANLVGGPAVDRWGERRLIHLGNILGIAGPFLVGFSSTVGLFYAGMLLIGLSGTSFVGSLALISESGKAPRVLMLNAAHGTMAIVLAFVPWVAGMLMDGGVTFQQLFLAGGWFSVIVAILFFFLKAPDTPRKRQQHLLATYKRLFAKPDFLVMLFGVFLYIGLETGVTTWIPLFLVNHDGLDMGLAGGCLMVFWLLMSGGRFLIPRLGLGVRPGAIVRTLLSFAVFMSAVVILPGPAWLHWLVLGLSGLGMSVSFPFFQAATAQMFPDSVGTAFGMLSATVGLSGTVFPSVMGWVSDLFPDGAGLRWAFLLPAVAGLVVSLLSVSMLRDLKCKARPKSYT